METPASNPALSFTRETGNVDAGCFPLRKFLRLSLKGCRKDFFFFSLKKPPEHLCHSPPARPAPRSCATHVQSPLQQGDAASSEFPHGDTHSWKQDIWGAAVYCSSFSTTETEVFPTHSPPYPAFQRTAFVLEKYRLVPKHLLFCSKLS